MPPIRVELEIADKKLKPGSIPPGVPGSFTDHNAEDPHLMIVSCNLDDDGGIVYRQDSGEGVLIANNRLRVVSDDIGDIEAVIGNGQSYERDITTKYGLGKLILTHYTE